MTDTPQTAELRAVLQRFQDFYTRRDPALVDECLDLFAQDDGIELIGTGGVRPGVDEWYLGRAGVRELLLYDWESWGDVALDTAAARIAVRAGCGLAGLPWHSDDEDRARGKPAPVSRCDPDFTPPAATVRHPTPCSISCAAGSTRCTSSKWAKSFPGRCASPPCWCPPKQAGSSTRCSSSLTRHLSSRPAPGRRRSARAHPRPGYNPLQYARSKEILCGVERPPDRHF